ncbi:hypothetical protein JKP88DRAFT_206685 [Tribonema minus]|uniref:D-xylose 1-dehydrogenase (NADP(+), D-xylono-1,5-lactone-forming) n=1 Tax=Tribonema minus TaxID=303371 RepID=A0A835ZDM6_9STRA|nr:hypothetical protein JKP88DRAFT_206685 [Tribonema minus]
MDIRLGLTKETESDRPPLRWGFMGAGRVCHDFVQALKYVPEAGVPVAVGCRELQRSVEFGDLHGIPNRYGSYVEVASDPNVEICYVGMLHPFHKDAALAALRGGKHVLVEKPVCCSADDAAEVAAEARARGLLLLEGMWTRFFPAVEHARALVARGAIGDVVAVHSDFGFNSTDVADYPDHLFYRREMGGGGLLYCAPYPVAAALAVLGAGAPTRIAAAGVKDEQTGVDMSAAIALHYAAPRAIGVLTYNLLGETPEETLIAGTRGRIRILGPAHCPTAMELTLKRPGRANVETRRYDYPLPPEPPAVRAAPAPGGDGGVFFYPNSAGFQYEAAAVHRCVRAGLGACPQYPPEESVATMRVLDEVRRQLGVEPV